MLEQGYQAGKTEVLLCSSMCICNQRHGGPLWMRRTCRATRSAKACHIYFLHALGVMCML